MAGHPTLSAGRKEIEDKIRTRLGDKFEGMMKALYNEKGSSFCIDILQETEVTDFIEAHSSVLDSSMEQVQMTDLMRQRLSRSNYIFSGLKTFHELNEAFPSLLDSDGNRKPFEQFYNEVQKIDSTYNKNYLQAEYNFIQSSAEMAGKWEQFMEDGDRYYLQYRTAGDDKVRPEHAALNGVTLPIGDKFWEEYYPPNGWNCRCTVVQVRKSKQAPTPHDEAMTRGEEALQLDTKQMFRFNPGKEERSVPKYNPYTISKCKTCNKNKARLVFVPSNELCASCAIINECYGNKEKSERAIERKHYLHKMEPLLKSRIQKNIEGRKINIGFSKYGNEHLFSDTFGRTRIIGKDDLKGLDSLLSNATYIEDSALTHARKDNIEHFYYFKTKVYGKWLRLNVAKQTYSGKDGRDIIRHFLYSINDIK